MMKESLSVDWLFKLWHLIIFFYLKLKTPGKMEELSIRGGNSGHDTIIRLENDTKLMGLD